MINILLKIPYFRKALVKRAFKITYQQRDEHAMTEYVFTDSEGKRYFKYLRPEWIPYSRYNQMQIRLLEIESRISRESLQEYSKANKLAAQKNDLILVARLAGELEERLEILYDPTLLMKFLCGTLIREDQFDTAHVWNKTLENEKFERLMADNENGNLSFFFAKMNLQEHVNYSNTSDTGLEEKLTQLQLKEVRLFDQMIQKVLGSLKPTS